MSDISPYFQSLKEPGLAWELLARLAVDQKFRNELQKRMQALPPGQTSILMKDLPPELRGNIDARNTRFMKRIVDRYGWPGKSLVREEAAQADWLLVQHADADREFQDRCLTLLREAFENGEATGQQVAYLTDRVLVGQGKKQLYGTQFQQVEGEFQPAPIEDEDQVDARRKFVGLPPLAEYARKLKAQ